MHSPSRSRWASASAALVLGALALLAAPSAAQVPIREAPNGIDAGTNFIVGGTTAQVNEFPSVAYLLMVLPNPADPTNKTFFTATCTGTMIQSTPVPVVLTAAHCLRAGEATLAVRAFVGATTTDLMCANQTTCREFTLQALRVNPQYAPGANLVDMTGHDAALWVLKQVDTRPLPPAMPMNGDPAVPAVNAPSVAVGWGLTNTGGSTAANPTPARMLQKVTLPVADNAACEAAFGYLPATRPLVGCLASGTNAAGQRTSTCQGDSGGPHIINGVQWAVTSAGPVPCDSGRPMILTRTSGIMAWVEATLAEVNAATANFVFTTVGSTTPMDMPANATAPAAAAAAITPVPMAVM